MGKRLDIANKRFGNLVAIEPALSRSGKTYWKCRCDCGNEKEIQTSHLISGSIKSCGCKNIYKEMVCPICGTKFIIDDFSQIKRKYCYKCSPIGRGSDYTPLYNAMKAAVVKQKGGKCQKCGYDKCIAALQFHHRNPNEKKFTLSMKSGSCEWEKFVEEANKCDLLCANCHAEEHYKESIKGQ